MLKSLDLKFSRYNYSMTTADLFINGILPAGRSLDPDKEADGPMVFGKRNLGFICLQKMSFVRMVSGKYFIAPCFSREF